MGSGTFTRTRERLLKYDVAAKFFYAVVEHARVARLMSAEHFTSTDGKPPLLVDFRVDQADGGCGTTQHP